MWHSFLLTLPGLPRMRWHPCSTAKVGVVLAQLGALHPSWKSWPSPSVCQLPSVTVCSSLSVTRTIPTNDAEGSHLTSLVVISDLDYPHHPELQASSGSFTCPHLHPLLISSTSPSACHLRHVGLLGLPGYSTRLMNSSPPTPYTLSPH